MDGEDRQLKQGYRQDPTTLLSVKQRVGPRGHVGGGVVDDAVDEVRRLRASRVPRGFLSAPWSTTTKAAFYSTRPAPMITTSPGSVPDVFHSSP